MVITKMLQSATPMLFETVSFTALSKRPGPFTQASPTYSFKRESTSGHTNTPAHVSEWTGNMPRCVDTADQGRGRDE